jgi:hypothetical protein
MLTSNTGTEEKSCEKYDKNTAHSLVNINQKDSWPEQILREEAVAVGGNAIEVAKRRSKQREQRHIDL